MLTGYNEAFIISTDKRNEILNNCLSADERKRTEELIRPILRGKDIKRYSYDWADLWLINTHNGIRGVKERIHIEDYPAIKTHLDQYWNKISKRADKGDTPYNLRNCAYLDDFNKPKIVYIEIMTDNPNDGYEFPAFAYDEIKAVVLNTAYIMVSDTHNIKYILGILNSSLGRYLLKLYVSQLGERQFRMLHQFITKVPLPIVDKTKEETIASIVENVIKLKGNLNEKKLQENIINHKVYELYGLSKDEIDFIANL